MRELGSPEMNVSRAKQIGPSVCNPRNLILLTESSKRRLCKADAKADGSVHSSAWVSVLVHFFNLVFKGKRKAGPLRKLKRRARTPKACGESG